MLTTHSIPGSQPSPALSLNHQTLGVPQKREQFDIVDRQLLSEECRHKQRAYIENKPCHLPGGLGKRHSPLPVTRDGNENICGTWTHTHTPNATWITVAGAPEKQHSSALQPHGKGELKDDGNFSLPSPCPCLCLSDLHTANTHRK